MEKLCERLGYTFKNETLMMTALTHPSYGSDHRVPHYQRLEFLGDAVLELAISRYLFDTLPDVDEGKLTRIRSILVREETLARAAKRIDLGRFIRLSVGEERSGGRQKASILADIIEALLAAVYLDDGFDRAVTIVGDLLGPEVAAAIEDRPDAKSALQELLQRNGDMPVYELLKTEGPPHAPRFTYCVRVRDEKVGEGVGTSKQSAQQAAAKDALKRMGALS